jgi:hypothetical protein
MTIPSNSWMGVDPSGKALVAHHVISAKIERFSVSSRPDHHQTTARGLEAGSTASLRQVKHSPNLCILARMSSLLRGFHTRLSCFYGSHRSLLPVFLFPVELMVSTVSCKYVTPRRRL